MSISDPTPAPATLEERFAEGDEHTVIDLKLKLVWLKQDTYQIAGKWLKVAYDPQLELWPQVTDKQFAQAVAIAKDVMLGKDEDLTNGAYYYCNPRHISRFGWFYRNVIAKGNKVTATVGRHTFYHKTEIELKA